MELWSLPEEFRSGCDGARRQGLTVGVVPTMGALHAGHLRLIEEARRHSRFVVVSVFVNPTQFGPHEDLSRYPRTLQADMEGSARAGADAVFAPGEDVMYRKGEETRVRVGDTASQLCGAHRPGHFEGVATVVAKLLALAGPCTAIFGRKDYQQLRVVQRMVEDLFLPAKIIGVPTVRDGDGLAMSSRNAYLSPEEREAARQIPLGLSEAARAFQAGERDVAVLTAIVQAHVEPVASSVDYVDAADPDTLRVCAPQERAGDRTLLALAVRIGRTRLIDNVLLGEDPPPLTEPESLTS
jgi:pantoate--beta-alanine ligase